MSNYHVEPADKPQALTTEALKAVRHEQVQGVSRRELLRGSLAAGMGLWLLELTAGTVGFLWPNLEGKFGGEVRVGTLDDVDRRRTPRCRSTRASRPTSAAPRRSSSSWTRASSGSSRARTPTGDGTNVNVRALYQRCPHLGCKPNPCLKNFWLECPCHGSRYDRLGIKAAGPQYGPAPRGMDRFGVKVSNDGRPDRRHRQDHARARCPIAVGQPGIEPPRSPTGCI